MKDFPKLANVAPASEDEVTARAISPTARRAYTGVSHSLGCQVKACSELLNAHLERNRDPESRSWYRMFKLADGAGTGRISYDEFVLMVRRKLKVAPSMYSAEKMREVWCSFDEGHSGFITIGEFGKFMQKGRKGRDQLSGSSVSQSAHRLNAIQRRVAYEEALSEEIASRDVIAVTSQVRIKYIGGGGGGSGGGDAAAAAASADDNDGYTR
ncbi:MAG: hypothetical protein SGPRY_009197 [Prymnesium sp.]